MQDAPEFQATVPEDLSRSSCREFAHADQPLGFKAPNDGAQVPVARDK